MSYFPPEVLTGTEFPLAWGKDVQTAAKLIERKYRRHAPPLSYYSIKAQVDVPDVELVDPLLGGIEGWTMFDPIEGETVPGTASGEWEQPHTSDSVDAAAHRVFEEAVVMHMSVKAEAKETELKTYGFEELRDLLVTIPKTILDAAGVTVTNGDELVWRKQRFEVIEWNNAGYWKSNPDVQFFIVINATHAKVGS